MDQRTLMTAPIANRTTTNSAVHPSASPFRGKRLSWAELYQERPDLRPPEEAKAKAGTKTKPKAKVVTRNASR